MRHGTGHRFGASRGGGGGSGAPAFNYLSNPGILVAHEADQLVTLGTGTKLATWGDVSGHSATSTAVASNEPNIIASHPAFDGHPGIDFGAAFPYGMTMSIASAASDYTIVSLLDVQNTAADQFLIGTAPGGVIFRVATQRSGGVGWYDGGYKSTGTPVSGAQVLAWRLEAGTAKAKVYRNGVQIGTSQNYTARACGSPIRLGLLEATTGDYFRGVIGKIVIANALWDEDTQLLPTMSKFAEWIP